MKSLLSSVVILRLSISALSTVYAGSATWNLNPISDDWNTAGNWRSARVPDGPADVAKIFRANDLDC